MKNAENEPKYRVYIIPGQIFHCTIILANLGTWKYAYLAHKIQNFLKQGGTGPFNSNIIVIHLERQLKFLAPQIHVFSQGSTAPFNAQESYIWI